LAVDDGAGGKSFLQGSAMIEVVCETCGMRLTAPIDRAGKKAKCPRCQSTVAIPLPKGRSESDELTPADESAINADNNAGAAAIHLLAQHVAEALLPLEKSAKAFERIAYWVYFWSLVALIPFLVWAIVFLIGVIIAVWRAST
jgi:uncharacterized Zn finger protein (UPF0148 family)